MTPAQNINRKIEVFIKRKSPALRYYLDNYAACVWRITNSSYTNEFEFFTAFGETGMALVAKRFPADRGIAGRALKELRTQVVNDVQSDPDFYCAIDEEHDFQTKMIISAPLISGDENVGVINAINKIAILFMKLDLGLNLNLLISLLQ